MNKTAMILFTRVPIPGQTKTRLAASIGAEEAASWHRLFIKKAARAMQNASDAIQADCFVFYTPADSENRLAAIIERDITQVVRYLPQQGADLWGKMSLAMQFCFESGYEKVLLFGSDIPEMTAEDLIDGFNKLDDLDAVIAPTVDEGYYLIGMRRYIPQAFLEIIPFQGGVYRATVQAIDRTGASCGLVTTRQDVDTEADLEEWLMRVHQGAYTQKTLKEHRERILGNV